MKCPACDSPQAPAAERCAECDRPLPPSCAGCGDALATDLGPGALCSSCRTDRTAVDALSNPPVDEGYPLGVAPVGQRALLARLVRLHASCRSEQALSFVALIGPPGSGKSRLVDELVANVERESPTTRILRVNAGGVGAGPYAAIARALWDRFGLGPSDDLATANRLVSEAVAEVLPASRATEAAHLIGHLCGYPFPRSPVVAQLEDSPSQLEMRIFLALRRFLVADVGRHPLLLAIDAAERLAPESVNLLHFLVAGMQESPLFVLCAGRPSVFEVNPSFGKGDVPLQRIDVPPLTPEESADLVRALLQPAGNVPPEILIHTRERLEGNPRAIVELVRLLVDRLIVRPTGDSTPSSPSTSAALGADSPPAWRLDRTSLRGFRLPDGPADILTARLDALPPASRQILERAAACGEFFWLDAVVALGRSEAQTEPSLDEIMAREDPGRFAVAQELSRLEAAELTVTRERSSIPGEREYAFAYDPIRRVVYSRIAEPTRRRYHRLIAQWIELRPEGRGADVQEEVARHLELAGDGPGAAQRYRRAADAARGRYFNDKAIRLYQAALRTLPDEDVAARIHVFHDLGGVYALKGDNEAAFAAFDRMLRLAWIATSRSKEAVAVNKMGRILRQKGELARALEYFETGRALFEGANDLRGVAASLEDVGAVLFLTGRSDEALDRSALALEMRRKIGDKRSIAHSLSNIGNIERSRGLYAEAEACHREALELRRQVVDRAGEVTSLNNLGILQHERGDADGARKQWESALKLAEEIGALPLQAILLNNLGELALLTGRAPEARQRLEETIQLSRELDDRRLLSEATRNLGLLELAAGLAEKARDLCKRSLDLAEQAGLRDYAGRSLLALAECHATTLFSDSGSQSVPIAEEYFRRAIELFRQISNDLELAKCLARFGRFRVERGDADGGRGLLVEASATYRKLGIAAAGEIDQMLAEL